MPTAIINQFLLQKSRLTYTYVYGTYIIFEKSNTYVLLFTTFSIDFNFNYLNQLDF